MADHAKPILTDNYTDVLSQIRGRFEDQAKGFDPANTTATSVSTGTIRWNSAEKKFQKWSGTAWGDLTDNYVLSGATFSTGTPNGVMYLNGSRVVTTGSALTFDGKNFSVTGTNTGTGGGAFAAVLNGSAYVLALGNRSAILGGSYDATPTVYYQSNSLAFFDANAGVEQMRLTSTGLGIGTSSPGTRLEVVGTGRFNSMEIGANNSDINNTNLNPIAFKIQGTERMRLDASGNLGLGVTPSAWGPGYYALQGTGYSLYSGNNNQVRLSSNEFINSSGASIYRASAASALYQQNAGVHAWFTAPSGTAGNPISFTQAMTLDANGNLGVGTSSPGYKLDVAGDVRSERWIGRINTSPPTADAFIYRPADNSLGFGTANTEHMRLDANGKLILSAANQGIQFADGTTQTTAGINPATAAAGAIGTMAMMINFSSTTLRFGDTITISSTPRELNYSSAEGSSFSSPPLGTVWRCMGYAAANGTTPANTRVSLFVRVS